MTIDINTHKNVLLKILKDLYTDPFLGPLLGFKGGTAAYLFYGLNRFSVDLDFDLLDDKKEEEVFSRAEAVVKKHGVIKDRMNKKHTLFLHLSYAKEAQNIKVEINKRVFNSRYGVGNYLGISMLVMKKEDMFAHKLVAMTERKKTANRDIFDVHFFLNNNWGINREIVEKRTAIKFIDYLKKCINFVDNISDREILAGIGELLDEKQKTWVKTKLKTDTIFLLRLMLDSEKTK